MRIAPISKSVNILPDKERFLSENERFDVSEATGVGEKRGSFRAYRKLDVRKAEDMSEKMDEAGFGRWGSKGFQRLILVNYMVSRIEWGYDLIRFFKAGE